MILNDSQYNTFVLVSGIFKLEFFVFSYYTISDREKEAMEQTVMIEMKSLKNVLPNLKEILPSGWIKEFMDKDLENGFIGQLDYLVKELIVEDDIYGANRRGSGSEVPDLGIVETNQESQAQYAWWNSETQSNWLDGFFRTSVMLRNQRMIEKAEKYLEQRRNTQEKDGYLGIYRPELRYQEGIENGELWAQATLMRALLAYYEYTQDPEVLESIEKALDLTMSKYPKGKSRPFSTDREDPGTCCAGLSHGLAITDGYLELYRITGEEKYLEYCVFLYENFSKEKRLESDVTISNLNSNPILFRSHGVHTYEHIRALGIFSAAAGKWEILEKCLEKLEDYLCPSGGPAGDEWIRPEGADASLTGYEYCSIHELLHSYCLLLQITGRAEWADRVEWLLFNAGKGAHHPTESAVAYLKSDNSYAMESVFQMPQPHCNVKKQTRYKYSPTHQDVAVCCVPNAGRIMPYYLQNMWHKKENGFTKMLYGPSVFETEYAGSRIRIEEESSYPAGKEILLKVFSERQAVFTLTLRKPSWWMAVTVENVHCEEEGDFLAIRREWSGLTEIKITYQQKLRLHPWKNGEFYFSYGANVLSLPIASQKRTVKRYALPGLEDTEYLPKENEFYGYELPADIENRLNDGMVESGIPVWNPNTGKEETCLFVPMGNTILRKVTFRKRTKK